VSTRRQTAEPIEHERSVGAVEKHAPLPVPLTETAALPVPTESAALDADLAELSRAVHLCFGQPVGANDDISAYTTKADLARMRRQLAVASKPARTDEIAHQAGRLIVSVPAAGGIDRDVLGHAICEEAACMQPSRFELDIAIRACRRHHWLSIATFVEELERARHRVHKYWHRLHDAEMLLEGPTEDGEDAE